MLHPLPHLLLAEHMEEGISHTVQSVLVPSLFPFAA
jgi:hypothetical protein